MSNTQPPESTSPDRGLWKRFDRSCGNHKDAIIGLGVLVAAIGFAATSAGLYFTWHQIRTAQRTLQATNAYQIQKDARELAESIYEITLDGSSPPIKMSEYLRNYSIVKMEKYDVSAAPVISRMFNFYQSVYRQSKNEGVAPEFAAAFGRDFCQLFRAPGIGRYWELRLKSASAPSDELLEMKNAWCA